MKRICLAECIHYITKIIPIEELEKMYDTPNYWWVQYIFDITEKYGFKMKRMNKSVWQCIACTKEGDKKNWWHAVVWNKGWIELNPYCVDLSNHTIDYFLKITKPKK